MSYLEYADYRNRSTELFSNLLAFGPASFSLGSGGEPQRIRGHLVSGSYFATLGAVPFAGRLLQPSDDRPGAPPAAVISYRVWHDRFGEADIVERPIVINGQQVTVVGVASNGFIGPELGQAADIWVPIAVLPVINAAQAGWIGGTRNIMAARDGPAPQWDHHSAGAGRAHRSCRNPRAGVSRDQQEPYGAGVGRRNGCPAFRTR